MGLGLIFDDLCVMFGVVVVWLFKGCKYSVWKELKTIKPLDFIRRPEGMIGFVAFAVIGCAIWAGVHFVPSVSK
jgi:hypothetical protein